MLIITSLTRFTPVTSRFTKVKKNKVKNGSEISQLSIQSFSEQRKTNLMTFFIMILFHSAISFDHKKITKFLSLLTKLWSLKKQSI